MPLSPPNGCSEYRLEHRNNRGHRRETHDQEEHRPPQPPERHVVEHIRQSDEYKAWSLPRLYMIGEAGRYDDEPGENSDNRIENADIHRLTNQCPIASYIATEYCHRADTQ